MSPNILSNLKTKLIIALLVLPTLFYVSVNVVGAAQLEKAYVRLNRMMINTATGGTICVQLTTAISTNPGSGNKIKVTFPSGYTVNGSKTNWIVNTSNLPSGSTAMVGISNPTEEVSGQIVSFPIGILPSNTDLYCFNFAGTNTLTNPTTAGSDKEGLIELISDNVVVQQSNFSTVAIDNDSVVLSATVPSTFSMSLGSNSHNIGVLSTSVVTSNASGIDMEIRTNAGNGWISWVSSLGQKLASTVKGDSIDTVGSATDDTPSELTPGSEGYVLDADLNKDSTTAGSGTVSISPEYNGNSTSKGGTLSSALQQFASANGPTDSDIIKLIPRVTISGMTEAASDYTDTLTIVAAGNF